MQFRAAISTSIVILETFPSPANKQTFVRPRNRTSWSLRSTRDSLDLTFKRQNSYVTRHELKNVRTSLDIFSMASLVKNEIKYWENDYFLENCAPKRSEFFLIASKWLFAEVTRAVTRVAINYPLEFVHCVS